MPISIDTALLSLYREIWLLVPLEGPISDYSFPFNCLSQDYWFPFKCLSQTMFQALNKDLKWSKAHASRKLTQAWPINSVYAVKTCCLFLLLITWITFHSSSDGYMQTHFSSKVVLTGIHWFAPDLLLITWITFHSSSDGYMQTHFSCKVVLTGIHWFGHHMQVRVSHFSSHSTYSLPVSLRLQMVSKWVSMLHRCKAKNCSVNFVEIHLRYSLLVSHLHFVSALTC